MPSNKVSVRRAKAEDIPAIIECSRAAYADYAEEHIYDERLYGMQLRAFPEGQFVALAGSRVVGYATSLIISLDDDEWYTVDEMTGAATFSTHNVLGDTLYGADIAVDPEFRRRGISSLLYERRRSLLRRFNLRRMVAYGRIPGYADHAGRMTAEEYVRRVIAGELKDPSLGAHLKTGFEVRKVQLDITVDGASLNYSTYLEMANPDFASARKRISTSLRRKPARRVRVCAAQYQMRPARSWEDVVYSMEFFAETADSYHCHFLLLPEYFMYHAFSYLQGESLLGLVTELAKLHDQYQETLARLSRKYGLYIIGGSMPVERGGLRYNVAHLFSPSGNVYTQDKLHITPIERAESGIEPGEGIRIFDTPLARIAIQICYDIEFPEVSRLLTLAGVEVIFVPFYTDEKKAYWRVRHCAQARAVENFIYVVIAGNVGNLRTRIGSFLTYGQSAVLTPSDFSFPEKGVEGEADPNVEATVVSELALSALSQQRHVASVRPLHDRRLDLYTLQGRQRVEIIQVE